MIAKQLIEEMYLEKGLSVNEVAKELDCSPNRITYWMDKYGIKRRSLSDAIYRKHNPGGDPFAIKNITSLEDALLYGIGIGLYWGEGTKASPSSVRLGNSDPELLKTFILFLTKICNVRKTSLRFGLQIFTDIDPEQALHYWMRKLSADRTQFYKIYITPSGSLGTYRKKSQYGVVTVYFNNKKLRDILVSSLQYPNVRG